MAAAPGPEEEVEEADHYRAEREFLATLPEEELEGWLQSVLDGEGVRECARRTGVTHTTVRERRRWGHKRLLKHARKCGLTGRTR